MTIIHALALVCLCGAPVVAIVFAIFCLRTDRSPSWSEYQWSDNE